MWHALHCLTVPVCCPSRLLHWGSAADPHSGAAPRVAISFAAADPSFEPGYFAKKSEQLPFPDADMRAVRLTSTCSLATFSFSHTSLKSACAEQALMAGNLLVYGQNEDPGSDLTALYW